MPKLPRFVMLPEDTPTEVCAYIKQLEWLAEMNKELINLIESSDYHPMCKCEHCKKVDELISRIEKELNRQDT